MESGTGSPRIGEVADAFKSLENANRNDGEKQATEVLSRYLKKDVDMSLPYDFVSQQVIKADGSGYVAENINYPDADPERLEPRISLLT